MTRNERNRLLRKIDKRVAQAGGWRGLARELDINVGTLRHIVAGERLPSSANRARLVAAGLLREPRPRRRRRIEWGVVARLVGVTDDELAARLREVKEMIDKGE